MAKEQHSHYCQKCDGGFVIVIDENETGHRFLTCPLCGWQHYRYFKDGIAVHCDITEAGNLPIHEITVRNSVARDMPFRR